VLKRDRRAAPLGEGGQPSTALRGDHVERVEPLRRLGVADQRDGGVVWVVASWQPTMAWKFEWQPDS
jgi:hypothetical protein